MDVLILYIYAYLVGSIPTAYLIGRFVKGIDIRNYGSGNVGGTNLFVDVGKWWTIPLGLVEVFIKGGSPIWIGIVVLNLEVGAGSNYWIFDYLLGINRTSATLAGAGLMSIIGNNWSIFLRFQGGRGMSVAMGSFLVMGFYQLLIFIFGCTIAWYFFRKSAAPIAIISLFLLPIWTYLIGQSNIVIWYFVGVLCIVSLKRLVSNWTPLPKEIKAYKVLLNRLLRDRDTDSREQWVHRVPKLEN